MSELLSKEQRAFLADLVFLFLVERELYMIRGDLASFLRGWRIDVDGHGLPVMVSKYSYKVEVELHCFTYGGGGGGGGGVTPLFFLDELKRPILASLGGLYHCNLSACYVLSGVAGTHLLVEFVDVLEGKKARRRKPL